MWRRRVYLLVLCSGILAALAMGFSLVLFNIERVDMAYKLKAAEALLGDKKDYVAKLEVERENLLAPRRLREVAERLGLHPAKQGQIRRVGEQPAKP